MNIVLIGYRGSGKTSTARHLGLVLGWPWVDADVELERRAGESIASIFEQQGEQAFRKLESAVLADLVQRDRVVLAAGGGAVLEECNRRALARASRVVWLEAQPATLLARIRGDGTTAARRPSLTSAGGLAEIEQLLAQRRPLYQRCAELAVDTEGKTPGEVADEIVKRLGITSRFPRERPT